MKRKREKERAQDFYQMITKFTNIYIFLPKFHEFPGYVKMIFLSFLQISRIMLLTFGHLFLKHSVYNGYATKEMLTRK
jgi:hypothetical protein